MANRNFDPLQVLGKEIKVLTGKISINASAVVTAVTGRGFTAARTGVGVYLVTFNDRWPALLAANLTMQKAAAANLFVEMISEAVLSAGTAQFRTISGATGAATDTAAVIDVYCTFYFRNLSSTTA